jgi:acetolactate synthase-1/2/3 large subunit
MVFVVDNIVNSLTSVGITTYFLVTGGAIVPFVDAVGRSEKTQHFCFQHEQAAAMAAEGYYRASGKIAAVLVTSGPGVQNILNGVCGCWYDSIPALFISGQVNVSESLDSITSSPRQLGFQEFPVESTFASCTKYVKKILTAADIQPVFHTAITKMLSGRRGPVLIDFPVNLQMGEGSVSFSLPPDEMVFPSKNVGTLIANAVRPLIIVGNGCREHMSSVRVWLEEVGIPFVTSWAACDLVEHTHPLRIGYHGVYGDRVANLALQNADLLLILGSRMDTRQTGGNLKICSARSTKIMVDIDVEEINKLTERGFVIDVPICGSILSFLSSNPPVACICSEWKTTLAKWKSAVGIEPNRVPGDVYDILSSIHLPEECIIIPDCGGNLVWAMQSLTLGPKQMLFTNFGNSSMGYALPASIGAAIATNKNIPIVCICGDGGIQMNVQELLTMSAFVLPVTVLIINNSGYGIIRQFQDQYFGSRYTATSRAEVFGNEGVDIAKIAKAYGVDSAVSKDIKIGMMPFLYDIQIEPTQKIYPKLEFGNALENMSPLFSLIESIMIVPYVQPNIVGGWVTK